MKPLVLFHGKTSNNVKLNTPNPFHPFCCTKSIEIAMDYSDDVNRGIVFIADLSLMKICNVYKHEGNASSTYFESMFQGDSNCTKYLEYLKYHFYNEKNSWMGLGMELYEIYKTTLSLGFPEEFKKLKSPSMDEIQRICRKLFMDTFGRYEFRHELTFFIIAKTLCGDFEKEIGKNDLCDFIRESVKKDEIEVDSVTGRRLFKGIFFDWVQKKSKVNVILERNTVTNKMGGDFENNAEYLFLDLKPLTFAVDHVLNLATLEKKILNFDDYTEESNREDFYHFILGLVKNEKI